MNYKVGDRVRIKSIDWYNENQSEGYVDVDDIFFSYDMVKYCSKILTITNIESEKYVMQNCPYAWSDGMIEGLVEEETKPNIIEEAKTYWDSIKDAWICPEGYIFKDENGNIINATKIVLEKKGKEYPKTYEECAEVLGECAIMTHGYKRDVLNALQKLIVCRDAYWLIAREEMGLGKPWEPDWKNSEEKRYSIVNIEGDINLPAEKTLTKWILKVINKILVFPTEEMRDAFYENFKELIESCKELL